MSAKEKEVKGDNPTVGKTGVELPVSGSGSVPPQPPGQDLSGPDQPREPEAQKESVGVDPAEANIILDAIFTRGVYEAEVELPKGHKCVFATRTTKLAKEILAKLEQDNPTRMPRYNQLYGAYCLAASLRSFDGKALPESFEERIKILDLWAGPLADILIDELVKFDDKVAAAYTTEQSKN